MEVETNKNLENLVTIFSRFRQKVTEIAQLEDHEAFLGEHKKCLDYSAIMGDFANDQCWQFKGLLASFKI